MPAPRRPPAAKLAGPSRSQCITRPPPLLQNFNRSTLSTASVSPPPTTSFHTPLRSHPPYSSSSLSSLDTLKFISRRNTSTSIHTDAITATTSTSTETHARSNSWWWPQSVGKEQSDDVLLSQDDQAATIQEEQRKIKSKYKATRNPVVFCHGLLGFDSVTIGPSIAPLRVKHWRGIKEVLEANGTEVLVTRVPATSSYIDRAMVLRDRISQVYPGRSVHLIGMSSGGLDCRYLATHLTDRNFQILSITTIATPHRGSPFADHFLAAVGRERIPQVITLLDLLPNGGGDGKAFECLTVEHMRQFNEETPDVDGIKYFSWGAKYEPGLIDTWKYPHSVILEREGENDGLVSVQSAKWGTYLGTLEDVNHLDLVGWLNLARYKWAEVMGREIKFHPATFYLGIVDMLAKNVEGQADEEAAEAASVIDQLPKNPVSGDQERAQMAVNLTTTNDNDHSTRT
ncbi:hypothetical protein M378DRAFT_94615 [Amanita muscaria Koide BX008]|uniref:GPI inositol-deacylase n=1 Tax=Amanita muscaria (strain Koide BX008) TaxID=946122 RepID=A0A0C2T6Z5_AMAMK|nr:hypothetical protein M378DRAFT_94615 [Amanita muscaria Koide BX008]